MASRLRGHQPHHQFLLPLAVYTFLISSLLYFSAALFLRSYNNSLSTQKQNVELQVAAVQEQNEEAERDINTLASQSRVTAVAQASLSYQAQNIITVTDGE